MPIKKLMKRIIIVILLFMMNLSSSMGQTIVKNDSIIIHRTWAINALKEREISKQKSFIIQQKTDSINFLLRRIDRKDSIILLLNGRIDNWKTIANLNEEKSKLWERHYGYNIDIIKEKDKQIKSLTRQIKINNIKIPVIVYIGFAVGWGIYKISQ